ncbi:MAG: EAL domain-containing protein [Lachnospiraceae bacterium]
MKNYNAKHIVSVFLILILLFIIIFSAYSYTKSIEKNADEYTKFTLDEMISLQKDAIYSYIVSGINMIESFATSFELSNVAAEEAIEIISNSMEYNEFQKIAIFDLDGNGYNSNGNIEKNTDYDFLEKLKNNGSLVYTIDLNKREERNIIISTPVLNDDKTIKYVIVGIYSVETIKEFIVKTFGKEGDIEVINSKGDLILSNKKNYELINNRKIYIEKMFSEENIHIDDSEIIQNLENGIGGSFFYEFEDELMYCNYMKLGINDWFLVVNVNRTNSNINLSGNYSIILLCIIVMCFCVLILYIVIARNNSKKELINVALYDKLTGLPSSENFKKEIRRVLAKHKEIDIYCMVFDVCNFKLINDKYGNDVGDELLKKIACVMKETENKYPSGKIYLSKLYSDTFAILVVNIKEKDLKEKAKLFLEKCRKESEFIEEYILNLSCGRYKIQHGDSEESVLEHALTAHAHSKNQKANIFIDYDNTFIERLHIESDILDSFNKAMKNGEFKIYLQPQYKASNGEISGAEALVRWFKDGKIKYPPNVFIPVLEDASRISELDSYLREEVCIAMRRWIDEGKQVVPISINVSRIELFEYDFVVKLVALVHKYKIHPNMLHIEITETAYVEDYEYLVQVVKELSAKGFHVEMDDFGSGYSSLNVLKDIPVDVVKLDMKFIEKGENETRSGSILSSVIRMIQGINLITIAEGVETREQMDYLRSIGCDYMQGYYFSKPMPLEEFENILEGNDKKIECKISQNIGIDDAANFLNATAQETLLFNTFSGGAAIIEYCNDELNVIRINDKCYEVLGQKRETYDVFHYNLFDVIAPEYRIQIKAALEESIETGKEVTGEGATLPMTEEGSVMWQRYSLRCLGKKGNRYIFYLVLNDITDRKRLEEHLNVEIEKSKALIASMPGGYLQVCVVDLKIKLNYASEGILKRIGYTLEELQALENFNDIIHPLDLERVEAAQKETIGNNKTFNMEQRYIAKNGDNIWFNCTGNYTRIDSRNGVFDGFFYDVTALHEAKEKISAFINSASDGYGEFVIKNGEISTEYVSEGFCNMSGYTYSEFMNVHINSFAHPDDMEMIEIAEYNTIVNNDPFRIEYRFRKKDGQYIWLRVVGKYVRNDASSGIFYGCFFDIDDYKRLLSEHRKSTVFN